MRIFFDVDTQNDFMNKNGALYVPDAEAIKLNLKRLTSHARENCIPVLGSVDLHFGTEEYKEREQELAKWGGPFQDHCMDKTFGQYKIIQTVVQLPYHMSDDCATYIPHPLIENVIKEKLKEELTALSKKTKFEFLASEEHLDNFYDYVTKGLDYHRIELAVNEIKLAQEDWKSEIPSRPPRPQGIYFEKQSYDVFKNPNIKEVLTRARVKEAVVYGVATDYCVKAAVLGMQKLGVQCYVVEDAIKGVAPESTKSALEEMAKEGAKFVKTQDVLEEKIK